MRASLAYTSSFCPHFALHIDLAMRTGNAGRPRAAHLRLDHPGQRQAGEHAR